MYNLKNICICFVNVLKLCPQVRFGAPQGKVRFCTVRLGLVGLGLVWYG